MAKNAKIGDLMFACMPLREEVIGDVIDLARRFNGEEGELWRAQVMGSVRKGLRPQEGPILEALTVVPFSIRVRSPDELRSFFESRPVLSVDDGFREILSQSFSGYGPPRLVPYVRPYTLSVEVALDREVLKGLPVQHKISPSELCPLLGTELALVLHNEKSALLSRKRATVFYCMHRVVNVLWDHGSRCWKIYTMNVGGGPHYKGDAFYIPVYGDETKF